MRGQYLEPITEDLKDKFLDLIASGYTRPEAAKALDASPRQFRALCNPESHRYDPEFARQYAKLTEKDGEHRAALSERLEAAAVERAIRSSDRLLEKLLVTYHPEWAIHRPQSMQFNFNIDAIRAEFAGLPDEMLHAYIEKKKQELREQGLLEAGPPDIDADAR